jgi:anaerobic selenocysteine-containing dehydrogenase
MTIDRRVFLKLTAVSGTTAALAGCGNPEHQLIRFVPDDDLVPGVAEWKPSVCPVCEAGCGLSVRVMEADVEVVRNGETGLVRMAVAKKLEGNSAHPISRGALCPRGQAAIQITYHPDRLTQPLRRNGPRGVGQWMPVTWEEAISEMVSRLDSLASRHEQSMLRFLTRRRRSRRFELVDRFSRSFGAPPPILFEPFEESVLRRANRLSFGSEQLLTFDLARSNELIVFGADFLGTWNSPVAQNRAYGDMRQGRPGVRGKLVQVESRMSQTGANADEWIPIPPGTDGVLALGLAHVMIAQGLRAAAGAGRAGALIDGWHDGLADYSPERVEAICGVARARVERLARELVERRPSVAMIGGAPLAQTNGLFHALAVNALNALLDSVGQPGGVFFMPDPFADKSDDRTEAATPDRTLPRILAEVLAADRSPIQLLLIDDANPVFATPVAWQARKALEKIPFIASFGSFLDETSVLADLILPDHSFLESWIDAAPESGAQLAVTSLAAPVMRPLHQTRAMPDVLLDVSRRLHRPLTSELPWKSFDEMLHAAFGGLPGTSGGDSWSTVQKQGGWWGEQSARSTMPTKAARPRNEAPRGPAVSRFVAPEFDGAAEEYPLHFLPYASAAFLDGSVAHLPWLQELPDPLTSGMWSSWVEINPRTAERFGIAQGDLVRVRSRHGSLEAPALVSPGIAPEVIAMPVGQGHETFTRYASGRGANPIAILGPLVEPQTGALAWAATRVNLARVGGATESQLILFAGGLREHPHAHEER